MDYRMGTEIGWMIPADGFARLCSRGRLSATMDTPLCVLFVSLACEINSDFVIDFDLFQTLESRAEAPR